MAGSITHRLLLVEQGSVRLGETLGPVLASVGMEVERESWDTTLGDRLRLCTAHIIVAGASPERTQALAFLEWLRANPVAIPMFAVLSEAADEELVRAAAAVADDFTLRPIRVAEVRHRVMRLLGADRGSGESLQRQL